MQHNHQETDTRPIGFYFLMALLTFLVTFLGFKFGSTVGAVVGFVLSCVVNGYALKIKLD